MRKLPPAMVMQMQVVIVDPPQVPKPWPLRMLKRKKQLHKRVSEPQLW